MSGLNPDGIYALTAMTIEDADMHEQGKHFLFAGDSAINASYF
jgi:hypothetical protein